MIVDLSQVLVRYDGEELKFGEEVLTLKRALLVALDLPREKVDIEKKMERHDLLMKIYKNAEVDFIAEEIAALKADCAETFVTPSALGAIHSALDPVG